MNIKQLRAVLRLAFIFSVIINKNVVDTSLYFIVLSYVMICYVMLYYIILYYIILYYIILYSPKDALYICLVKGKAVP